MNIPMNIAACATALAMLFAAPVKAGGPVITEDETEFAAPAGYRFKDALPLIVLGIAIAAIASGGSDNCNTPDPVQPEEGC